MSNLGVLCQHAAQGCGSSIRFRPFFQVPYLSLAAIQSLLPENDRTDSDKNNSAVIELLIMGKKNGHVFL